MPAPPRKRELSAAERAAERAAEAEDDQDNPLAQIYRIVTGCARPTDGRPPRYQPAQAPDAELALALKSVLNGDVIARELFLALFRRGYVVKDMAGRWQLTPMGKALLRAHHL